MLKIYTTQITYTNFVEIKKDPKCLDITRKSGNLIFAPTWEMILGYKNGRMSEEYYTKLYNQLMHNSYKNNKKAWIDLLEKKEICLCCYCFKDSFCHRFLLAKMLEKLNGKYVGEVDYKALWEVNTKKYCEICGKEYKNMSDDYICEECYTENL